MKRVLLFVFVMISGLLYSQQDKPGKTKINLKHAKTLKGDKTQGFQRLIGEVQFEHQGMLMSCDSAHFHTQENSLEAFGHVFITQGDSLRMWSDFLTYNGNTRIVVANKNVRLIEGDMTLTTDAITYDINNKFAYYNSGGRIVNRENILTSVNGGYSSETKTLTFKKNVVLKNPQYEMRCDTLRYTPGPRVAYFLGPTTIRSTGSSNYIYCENGFYDTQHDIAQFDEKAFIVTNAQTLKGDSIWYDRKNGIGKAFGRIQIKDTTQKVNIYGDYAIHYEKSETSWISGHALMVQQFDNDSLYLHADTLKSVTTRPRDAKGKPLMYDSLAEKTVLAYHRVKFFKSDLQGKCDSLSWTSKDSTMRLYGAPVLWTDGSQLTAKNISILLSDGKIMRLDMESECFLASQEDTVRFNQIKGRKMTGYFENNQLNRIFVEGNGQTLYYVTSENQNIGINRADCSKLMIWVNESKIKAISFYSQPEAQLYPPGELTPSEAVLKDFSWRGDEKPLSKEDLFLR